MADPRGGGSHDVALAGRRLRQKVKVALTLSAVLPLLVLAYVVVRFVLPGPSAGEAVPLGWLQALLLFTVLGIVAGAYVVWDLGRVVARMAEMLGQARPIPDLDRRRDEMSTVM